MNTELILQLIAGLILGFTILQWLVALLNFLFRADYSRYKSDSKSLITIIIPARNEENSIGKLLNDLKEQSYSNIEIIVVNDESTDQTAEVVKVAQNTDPRVRLMDVKLTDGEWLGKNYACFSGARTAKGKHLLFLDADVRLGNTALSSALGYFQQERLVFMSVFPRQLIPDISVYQVIPLMNYILLSLLPLMAVKNLPFRSMSAANGQFMLFDNDLYRALEPHKKYRKEKVEDIHIARYIKGMGYRIACLTGNTDLSCNMYDSYEKAMEGFSKNIVAFFGNSAIAGILFWFITFTGILWMPVISWYLIPVYLILILSTRHLISRVSMQDVLLNSGMHYRQLWTLGKLMFRAIQHKKNNSFTWKERSIN